MVIIGRTKTPRVTHPDRRPAGGRYIKAAFVFLPVNRRITVPQKFVMTGELLRSGAPLLLELSLGKQRRSRVGRITQKKVLFRSHAVEPAGSKSELVLHRIERIIRIPFP